MTGTPAAPASAGLLRALGIAGWDALEPAILAALATESPILLDRPPRDGQDAAPRAPGRGARPRLPPLQRLHPQLRRPARLPGAAGRPPRLPADARHDLGGGGGALRRGLALPARAPEQALPARPRARGPGPAADAAATPLGRDEPAARRAGRRRATAVGYDGRRAARRGARRPLRVRARGPRARAAGRRGQADRAPGRRPARSPTPGRRCGRRSIVAGSSSPRRRPACAGARPSTRTSSPRSSPPPATRSRRGAPSPSCATSSRCGRRSRSCADEAARSGDGREDGVPDRRGDRGRLLLAPPASRCPTRRGAVPSKATSSSPPTARRGRRHAWPPTRPSGPCSPRRTRCGASRSRSSSTLPPGEAGAVIADGFSSLPRPVRLVTSAVLFPRLAERPDLPATHARGGGRGLRRASPAAGARP